MKYSPVFVISHSISNYNFPLGIELPHENRSWVFVFLKITLIGMFETGFIFRRDFPRKMNVSPFKKISGI